MQKNLIMAIVLSVVVLLLYNIFIGSRQQPAVSPPTEEAMQSSPWLEETPRQGEILPSLQLEEGEEIILEIVYV